MIVVKGSREYLGKVFGCWREVDRCIGELEGDIVLGEGDSPSFDAWTPYLTNDSEYFIITEDPEKVQVLVRFLKYQAETWQRYSEPINLIITKHVEQAKEYFNSRERAALFPAYASYMKDFLQYFLSSIVKSLVLSHQKELRDEFASIKEACEPLKIDLKKTPRSTLYKILADNLWRKSLRFKQFDVFHKEVAELDLALNAVLEALNEPGFEHISRAAEALTRLSFEILMNCSEPNGRKTVAPSYRC